MGDHQTEPGSVNRGTTLNSLKEQLYSLNMRMLLAMQNHDEDAQKDIKEQMAAVQEEIDRMCLGSGFRHRPMRPCKQIQMRKSRFRLVAESGISGYAALCALKFTTRPLGSSTSLTVSGKPGAAGSMGAQGAGGTCSAPAKAKPRRRGGGGSEGAARPGEGRHVQPDEKVQIGRAHV